LKHDHLPIERTSRQKRERVREPTTSNGQDERATKTDRELGLWRGNSGQKVESALAHRPSVATVINLKPNTRQRPSEQAESGLERTEVSMRIGQGHSDVRSQTSANRIAADATPARSKGERRTVRRELLAGVDNRAAGKETATTTVASNPADSPSTAACEETKWAKLRARLARLRSDLELTTEFE
jgi:hypothetical protein